MNGLAMIDRHSHQAHIPYNAARYFETRPSQLPMPILRGRRDPYEDSRRHPVASPSTASESSLVSPNCTKFWGAHQHQHDFGSRERSSTLSTTYSHGDNNNNNNNRPSLPSLRTVLGETAKSPPPTPGHPSSTMQPHPREPVYDQSTYKPSSLYPNKRTRTDSGWDGQGSDRKNGERSPGTLPFLSNHQSERAKPPHQLELPTLSATSPDAYRQRHPGNHTDDRSIIHETLNHHTSPEMRGRTAQVPTSPRLAQAQTFEGQSRSHAHYRLQQPPEVSRDVHMDGPRPSAYNSTITHSRSPSIALPEDRSQDHSGYSHPSALQQPCRSDGRRHSLIAGAPNPAYRDDYSGMNRLNTSYNTPHYPYAQAFFVPSHYEYQNGKSRKRSNLPKQSTEIMKRWFDDNLQNPYPSEEQKRHFAAVAGINLTQVSNWFINHRRRCPELREKRDKGRAGSRDESV